MTGLLNPFRAPKSLPVLNSSQFLKKVSSEGVTALGRSFLCGNIFFSLYLGHESGHHKGAFSFCSALFFFGVRYKTPHEKSIRNKYGAPFFRCILAVFFTNNRPPWDCSKLFASKTVFVPEIWRSLGEDPHFFFGFSPTVDACFDGGTVTLFLATFVFWMTRLLKPKSSEYWLFLFGNMDRFSTALPTWGTNHLELD